jgi:hypothetical protein
MDKFKVVCAAQLRGALGMQLWGVSEDGHLFSTFQKGPYGPWEKWSQWAGQGIDHLTAAPNGRGEVSLWALVDGYIFATSQRSVGDVNWGWSNPGPAYDPSRPGDPPGEWRYPGPIPMRLQMICACEPSYKGSFGRQLWAVGRDNCLYYTYETNRPDGDWSPWKSWEQPQIDKGQFFNSLTAAQNGQGEVSLWAVEYPSGVLHCRSQIKAGEAWDPWVKGWSPVGPFGTPTPVKFSKIWACRQGGSLGRALWGVAGGNGELYWTYEKAAMGGGWTPWERFPGPGDAVMNLTTVRRQDGRVALWAYSRSNVLYNNIQRVAGGENWAGWDRGGTWQENFGIIAEIENTLARDIDPKDHKPSNKDVTYLRTSGNKFTRLDTPGLWGDATKKRGTPTLVKSCLSKLRM